MLSSLGVIADGSELLPPDAVREIVGRARRLGRISAVVDGTGVGRAFTDIIREAGVTTTPVTITGGGNQSRGEKGYWNVSKMVLLSELAAHIESGRLRTINSPMGQELTAKLLINSFEVDFTSAGNMRVDVRSKDHHGDLVIATALALWSAVVRPSGTLARSARMHGSSFAASTATRSKSSLSCCQTRKF